MKCEDRVRARKSGGGIATTIWINVKMINWFYFTFKNCWSLFIYHIVFLLAMHIHFTYIYANTAVSAATHTLTQSDAMICVWFEWIWHLINFELSSVEETDQRNYICSHVWRGKWSVKVNRIHSAFHTLFVRLLCCVHLLFVWFNIRNIERNG